MGKKGHKAPRVKKRWEQAKSPFAKIERKLEALRKYLKEEQVKAKKHEI